MRVAIAVLLVLGACKADDWLPPGPVCPPPDPWTWTDVVRAPSWQAWTQTRDGCGFPDRTIEYRVWAQTARGRVLLFEGEMEQKWWNPPLAADGGNAFAFGGRTCSLDGGDVRCR